MSAIVLEASQLNEKNNLSIFHKIVSIFQDKNFKTVRIEKIKPIDTDYEVNTDTVWFENHNIEDCIRATQRFGIKHIHIQTNNIDFLADPRLQNIKGVRIQYEIQNIAPLFNLRELTHLSLPDNIDTEFDFSNFKNLVFLGGTLPKRYVNIDQLSKLKYTHLFGYRKSDLRDFANSKDLRKLWMYSLDIQNLNGLSDLAKLSVLSLENCRKLTSLEGIGSGNINLQTVHLSNCKKLKNADALALLPDLKQLRLHQIQELNSLEFLHALHKLETLILHPDQVGVHNHDYYPLVETLKKLNKLNNLKGWKPLKEYLDGRIVIESIADGQKTELALIKEGLNIMSWVEKKEGGLKQYSARNCRKAETIILDLLGRLETVAQSDFAAKEELIKESILKLNKLNDSLEGRFIETGEREELCDLFDNIADAVGLNVQDYEGGIAGKWRTW